MKLKNRKNENIVIVVDSKKNKINVKNGFVRITKGDHYGHETIRPDILADMYIIPDNATFSE